MPWWTNGNVFIAFLVAALCCAWSTDAAAVTRIVVLGDSIASGWGLAEPARDSFPARLETALRSEGHDVRVVNAGVAGDTTASGLARLDWTLGGKPDIVIVELGANDMLRGIDPSETRKNLTAILQRLKTARLGVLLTGMLAAPNLGVEYGKAFDAVFPALAESFGVAFYPFLLDGVAARPEFNQGDGIHPNAKGAAVLVDRIAPYVVRLLNGNAGSR